MIYWTKNSLNEEPKSVSSYKFMKTVLESEGKRWLLTAQQETDCELLHQQTQTHGDGRMN